MQLPRSNINWQKPRISTSHIITTYTETFEPSLVPLLPRLLRDEWQPDSAVGASQDWLIAGSSKANFLLPNETAHKSQLLRYSLCSVLAFNDCSDFYTTDASSWLYCTVSRECSQHARFVSGIPFIDMLNAFQFLHNGGSALCYGYRPIVWA